MLYFTSYFSPSFVNMFQKIVYLQRISQNVPFLIWQLYQLLSKVSNFNSIPSALRT